jgi:hypothetical protein
MINKEIVSSGFFMPPTKLAIPMLIAFACAAPAQAAPLTLGPDLLNHSVLSGTYVSTGDSADVYGNVAATTYLTTGAGSRIFGDGSTGDVGTTGAQSAVTGTRSAITGNFLSRNAGTLGANSDIGGDFLAGGVLATGAGATVAGDTRAPTAAEITAMDASRDAAISDLNAAKSALTAKGTGTALAATMTVDSTFSAGVYSAASWSTTASTILTLDNQGMDDAEWVFNITDILALGANTQIVLLGSGTNSSVFWNVGDEAGYASVGDGAVFIGAILATDYIMVGANAVNLGNTSDCGGLYSSTSYVSIGAGAQVGSTSCLPISEVPVPAALWLFGSALIGLVGVSRR